MPSIKDSLDGTVKLAKSIAAELDAADAWAAPVVAEAVAVATDETGEREVILGLAVEAPTEAGAAVPGQDVATQAMETAVIEGLKRPGPWKVGTVGPVIAVITTRSMI